MQGADTCTESLSLRADAFVRLSCTCQQPHPTDSLCARSALDKGTVWISIRDGMAISEFNGHGAYKGCAESNV